MDSQIIPKKKWAVSEDYGRCCFIAALSSGVLSVVVVPNTFARWMKNIINRYLKIEKLKYRLINIIFLAYRYLLPVILNYFCR